jgi:hypothetical protein
VEVVAISKLGCIYFFSIEISVYMFLRTPNSFLSYYQLLLRIGVYSILNNQFSIMYSFRSFDPDDLNIFDLISRRVDFSDEISILTVITLAYHS